MAKTIEERAKEFANDYTLDDAIFIKGFLHTACYDGYCDGATDQRKIDIEKACSLTEELIENIVKVLTNNLGIDLDVQSLKTKASNDMRKAMEEE